MDSSADCRATTRGPSQHRGRGVRGGRTVPVEPGVRHAVGGPPTRGFATGGSGKAGRTPDQAAKATDRFILQRESRGNPGTCLPLPAECQQGQCDSNDELNRSSQGRRTLQLVLDSGRVPSPANRFSFAPSTQVFMENRNADTIQLDDRSSWIQLSFH